MYYSFNGSRLSLETVCFGCSLSVLIISESTYGNNYLSNRYIRTLSNIDLSL